jgi:type II secretory pathway pseudopilin PulG
MSKINPEVICAPWPHKQRGMMLVAVLIFFAVSSYAAFKSSEVWATVVVREQEQELLFAGDQYRMAIERYYHSTPGTVKALPRTLNDLVDDNRFPVAQHHLRKLYQDPIRGSDTWGLLWSGSGITGVFSLSEQKPVKKSGFENPYEKFNSAPNYRGWRFIFTPPPQRIAAVSIAAPVKNSIAQSTPVFEQVLK